MIRSIFKYVLILLLVLGCSGNDSEEEIKKDPNITYEVLLWNYIIDLENETVDWEYRIEFKNNSDFKVNGTPKIYYRTKGDDLIVSNVYIVPYTPCASIEAGERCVVEFQKSAKIDFNLEPEPKPVEFVSAEYIVVDVD